MESFVDIGDVQRLDWRKFDEIALDGRRHGFTLAVYRSPTGSRGDALARLVIKVDDATNPATQAHVKRLWGIAEAEPGWLV